MRKPILSLDFDGVIHSYSSGWKGAANIPDEPVAGSLEFIVAALKRFDVQIFSSRSHQWGGRRAMKRWLKLHLERLGNGDPCPKWWFDFICENSAMEPWHVTVRDCAEIVADRVKWPFFKPPAMISIDDRGLTFTGTWPSLDELAAFKPWNKKAA